MKKGILGFFVFGFVLAMSLQFMVLEAAAYDALFNKTELHRDGECMTLSWSGFWDTTRLLIYKNGAFWVSANNDAAAEGSQPICVDTGWEYGNNYKIRVERKADPSVFVWANDGDTFSVVGYPNQIIDFTINNGNTTTTQRAVTLQFNFTSNSERPAPTQYMVSESSSFAGASWQTYTSNTVSYTLSTGAGVKDVYIKVKNIWGESNWKWDSITYSATYDISGYVRDENVNGISGAEVSGLPCGSVLTNQYGYFICSDVIYTWTGTVTASKTGYIFSPISINGLSSDRVLYFNGTPVASYSWYIGEWGECTDSCGGGEKTRIVECRDNNGQTVDDSNCTGTKEATVSYDCPLGDSRLSNGLGTEQYISPQ